MDIQFFVPGMPQGKGRARAFISQTGKIGHITPEKTRTYEGIIRTLAMDAMGTTPPLEGALAMEIEITMAVPGSWPQWKRDLALAHAMRPTTKPDSDNVEKAVKDALNGVVWRDDVQIVQDNKLKVYGATPGVQVTVHVLGALPAQISKKPKE